MSKSAGDYAHVEIGCSSPLCDVLCPCGFHMDLIRVIGEAQEESREAGRRAALVEAAHICEEKAEYEVAVAWILALGRLHKGSNRARQALHVGARNRVVGLGDIDLSAASACAALAVRIRALREVAE